MWSWSSWAGGGAFSGVGGESRWVVDKWVLGAVLGSCSMGDGEVGLEQGVTLFVEAVKGIDIDHHARRAVNANEIVGKEFLREP